MGWNTIKQALKNADMRKRIFVVAALILLYRVLAHIPIPIAEPDTLRQLINNVFNSQDLLGFIDLLSGGSLQNFSIMLMGLGPFINASIIMQLLTKAIPRLEEIQKDGEAGRKKINQYTRIVALPLGIVQSIGLVLILRQQASQFSGAGDFTQSASLFDWVLMISALSGGSMLLMWLGELMTEQGVGNGISLLIFASIVSQLPSIGTILFETVRQSSGQFSVFGLTTVNLNLATVGLVVGLVLLSLILTYLVVKLNEAQRIVTVSYAKRVRGNRSYGGVDTVLPIKLITAGVIPVIFAFAFLSVPTFVGQLIQTSSNPDLATWGVRLSQWFGLPGSGTQTGAGSVIYITALFTLVVAFTYFYTGISFNSKEISENLQKEGGFVTGIRPGAQTEQYLKKIVNRLTFFGAISLGLLSIIPSIIAFYFNTNQLAIGGTGMLIVVSVAIETLRQVESRALMVTYDQPE